MKLNLIAPALLLALCATGCDWAVGEEGETRIGWVSDQAVVLPMTVDPTDTTVPPEVEAMFTWLDGVSGGGPSWDNTPFSWQCYNWTAAWDGLPQFFDEGPPIPGPVPDLPLQLTRVEGLAVPLNTDAGDFIEVSYQSELGQYPADSLCSQDPSFISLGPDGFADDLNTVAPGFGSNFCDFGVFAGGQLVDDVRGSDGSLRSLLVGPLDDGVTVVEFAVGYCTGAQYDLASLLLMAEHVVVASSGTIP